MKVALSWLEKFVQLPPNLSAKEIAEALTLSTVEVEEVVDLSEQFNNMVVGKIVEIKPHPNADKLRLAMTDIGGGEIKQIVCGGTNLFTGMLVAVALPGSFVKWHGQGDLVKLEKAKIRGEESFGMICAAEEIGLADLFPQATGTEIINLSFLEVEPGTPLGKALSLDDFVLEIDNKSLTNRPDLWGHYGIARELSAIYQVDLGKVPVDRINIDNKSNILRVNIKSSDCRRYLGAMVQGVKVGPSPWWLASQLFKVGIRPINNIVDLTNYVMLELGQPLHAFDASYIPGGDIVVRPANSDEPFQALDGKEYKLSATDLVIANHKQPIALAGIIGGADSAISDVTSAVIFESANFDPVTIRRSSKRLGIRTDSSARFEKGLDPELAYLGMRRVLTLVSKLFDEVKIEAVVDNYLEPLQPAVITVNLDFLNKKIGQEIDISEAADILRRLDFSTKVKGKTMEIKVPTWRSTGDISLPEDIVEEVARILGYGNIRPSLPIVKLYPPPPDRMRKLKRQIKNYLTFSADLTEVLSYPFVDEVVKDKWGFNDGDLVYLQNPIASNLNILRPTLLPNLLKFLLDNMRWQEQVGLFEIGRVFRYQPSEWPRTPKGDSFLPWQDYHLAFGLAGKSAEYYLRAKGIVEGLLDYLHISDYKWQEAGDEFAVEMGKTLQLYLLINNENIGSIFIPNQDLIKAYDIESEVVMGEFNFNILARNYHSQHQYTPLPKYPSVVYDLAVIFPSEVKWEEIVGVIKSASNLARKIYPFDVYHGKQIPAGHKSIAFTIEFADPDKTLTSSEVEAEIKNILKLLDEKLGGKLRQN